jgi:hypothetical protein
MAATSHSRTPSRLYTSKLVQNGRSLRRRPRAHQGPRGLHRQGREHQLHDGVAAPQQQVSSQQPAISLSLSQRFTIILFRSDHEGAARDGRGSRRLLAPRAFVSPRRRPRRSYLNASRKGGTTCARRLPQWNHPPFSFFPWPRSILLSREAELRG